jgi:NAD(P)-dependent dehydrogenase (short-subunit alcohol dehydrogenase family)
MAGRFAEKSVFITGASSGLGAAMARAFAQEGARLALAARREDWLVRVKEDIESLGGQALICCCDVNDRASIDTAVASAVEAFGGIDVAVANAGFGVSGPFQRLTTDDFRRQFETNLFGLLNTVYAVLPHLAGSRGRLGLVSSVMGRVGAPASAPYCASKFAVCGLAECLYYDLADSGVSVTCIDPGLVDSNIRMTGNDGVYRDDLKDPAPSWLVAPAGKAARAMVRALYRRKPEAVITGHGKFAVWMTRHFPRTVRWVVRLGSKGRIEEVRKRKGI